MTRPIDTGFPADSLEFCPHPSARDIFVCGTYKLEEEKLSPGSERKTPQRRHGECLVFQVENNDSDSISWYTPSLPITHLWIPNCFSSHKIQEFGLPAVLDMKWYL